MKKWAFSLPMVLIGVALHAQTKYTAEDYIRMYHDAAVNNMVQHKVPASITLAQGLFESGYGNSELAINANNHFGIKCHEWTGDTYRHDDDAPQECFRKYANVQDSYADHAQFLKNRKRYSKCFDLDICDYKGWATELKAAGYATLPTYPQRIVELIERFKLYDYDKQALELMGQKPEDKKLQETVTEIALTPVKETEKTIEDKTNPPKGEKITERVIIQEKIEEEKVSTQREIFENNGVSYIVAKKGDTQLLLATELEMAEWQIRRYNDLDINEPIVPGMRIYLAPKKDYSDQIDAHVVMEGENLEQIAQLHGVKKSSIIEMNGLNGEAITTGQTLRLK